MKKILLAAVAVLALCSSAARANEFDDQLKLTQDQLNLTQQILDQDRSLMDEYAYEMLNFASAASVSGHHLLTMSRKNALAMCAGWSRVNINKSILRMTNAVITSQVYHMASPYSIYAAMTPTASETAVKAACHAAWEAKTPTVVLF